MTEQPTQYVPNPVLENASIHQSATASATQSAQAQEMQYQIEEAEKSLAEAQLECDGTLKKIYHLLKQDILTFNEKTKMMDWVELKDQTQRVLTDLGVDKIMQVMQSYINKETLLSNFSEKQINTRMLEFALALNSNLFMKYEIYFRVPTLEECKTILKQRIEEQKQLKLLAAELAGVTPDEEKITKEIMEATEERIHYEMQKIKDEQKKINLREYEILFVQLKALVEATHNRAWKGEERGSLRRHFNISEVIGTGQNQQQKTGGFLGFGKK